MQATRRSLKRLHCTRASLVVIAVVATLALFTSGCQSSCQTGQQDGLLVADGSTLSVRVASGATDAVAWPFGYGVREEGGTRVLVDQLGNVKAREGDHIQVAGGLGPDGVWHACGDVKVVAT